MLAQKKAEELETKKLKDEHENKLKEKDEEKSKLSSKIEVLENFWDKFLGNL